MKNFRVVVAGGRDFNNYILLKRKLDVYLSAYKAITIISGGARGADALGEMYAKEKGYELIVYKAEWGKYGKGAGYIRNKEMAKASDAVVVCWDGESRGTKNMKDLAGEYKKPLRVISY